MGTTNTTKPLKIVVLISGNGSNLQAIIDAIKNQSLPVEISAVISNRPDAYGLTRARKQGIETIVLDHKQHADRRHYDHILREQIDKFHPHLVVLAGFMRILSTAFVNHYRGQLINIHPSLLPAFTGLNTHQRAIDAGVKEHGVSIHFVTDELDSGPVILQAKTTIETHDTAETLAEKIQALEHKIYPLVIRWFAEGRLQQRKNHAYFDDQLLTTPRRYEDSQPA